MLGVLGFAANAHTKWSKNDHSVRSPQSQIPHFAHLAPGASGRSRLPHQNPRQKVFMNRRCLDFLHALIRKGFFTLSTLKTFVLSPRYHT